MFIENCDYLEVIYGTHSDPGNNSILIRILDYSNENPTDPKYKFSNIYSFYFEDLLPGEALFSTRGPKEKQILDLIEILKQARDLKANVIVHCTAGISRSGAIAQFANEALGFDLKDKKRTPNSHLLNTLHQAYKEDMEKTVELNSKTSDHYMVVGGLYNNDFSAVVQNVQYGPFKTYEEAHKIWQKHSWANVDTCNFRLEIKAL